MSSNWTNESMRLGITHILSYERLFAMPLYQPSTSDSFMRISIPLTSMILSEFFQSKNFLGLSCRACLLVLFRWQPVLEPTWVLENSVLSNCWDSHNNHLYGYVHKKHSYPFDLASGARSDTRYNISIESYLYKIIYPYITSLQTLPF